MGKRGKQWQTLFSWAPKSLQMVTAGMKLKESCSLEEKLWQIRRGLTLLSQLCRDPAVGVRNAGEAWGACLPSRCQLFATPWTAARQSSLSFTNSWSLLKLVSIESVMPCNHLILCLLPTFLTKKNQRQFWWTWLKSNVIQWIKGIMGIKNLLYMVFVTVLHLL